MRLRRLTMLVSIMSQVFAFSTMFVIVGGLFPGGDRLSFIFFLFALILCLFIFLLRLFRNHLPERCLFLVGLMPLVCGIGTSFILLQEPDPLQLCFFAVAGIFLLQRFILMNPQNPNSMRNMLLAHYRLDVSTVIILTFLTLLFQIEETWQSAVIPFFVAFVFTRLYSLSLTSRIEAGADHDSFRAGRLPLVLIGVAIAGGWILSVSGIPLAKSMFTLISYLLTPLLYIVGFIGSLVIQWLTETKVDQEAVQSVLRDMGEDQATVNMINRNAHSVASLDWVFSGLAIILCTVLIRFIYKRLEQGRDETVSDPTVEIREFIRREDGRPMRKEALYHASRPLTPVREIYRQFLLKMKKAGYARNEGETPLEYAEQLSSTQPDLYEPVQELTNYYMQERYGDKKVEDQRRRMEQLVDVLTNKADK